MTDHFTASFIDSPGAFPLLHQQLKKRGFVTYTEPSGLSRPAHNSLNEERYQAMFETHFPSQYTSVKAAVHTFDVGNGFPDF